MNRLSEDSRFLRFRAGSFWLSMASPLVMARRVPWARAWLVARWLYQHGRERVQKNLNERERRELWELMKRSQGRRSNLSRREQDRFVALARKAARGGD